MRHPIPYAAIALVVLTVPGTAGESETNAAWLSELENAVVREHNLVRSDPAAYAAHLEEWRSYYRGKQRRIPGRRPINTIEGIEGVDEAIRFLATADPQEPLRPSHGLSRAAEDHTHDSGEKGWMGHTGSDGSEPGDRANRHGKWYGRVGENIVYGGLDAREFVIRLLIDDGIPERTHRANIFNPAYHFVGVAFGCHSEYGSMCVITYAAEYEEN